MKYFFATTFIVLVLLSAVAWRVQPRDTAQGKIPLIWVSDDNPARREETPVRRGVVRWKVEGVSSRQVL